MRFPDEASEGLEEFPSGRCDALQRRVKRPRRVERREDPLGVESFEGCGNRQDIFFLVDQSGRDERLEREKSLVLALIQDAERCEELLMTLRHGGEKGAAPRHPVKPGRGRLDVDDEFIDEPFVQQRRDNVGLPCVGVDGSAEPALPARAKELEERSLLEQGLAAREERLRRAGARDERRHLLRLLHLAGAELDEVRHVAISAPVIAPRERDDESAVDDRHFVDIRVHLRGASLRALKYCARSGAYGSGAAVAIAASSVSAPSFHEFERQIEAR